MGNHMSHRPLNGPGRVILSDGTVHKYDKPLTVAELMLEYPQQVVVEFQTAVTNGKRPTPLPADTKLETNKLYVMLPMRRGKPPAMSSEEARRLLLCANAVLNSKSILSSYTGFLPLFARICPAVAGGNGLVTKAVVGKREKENSKLEATAKEMWKTGFFEEIREERGDYNYLSRQFSGKGSWKPSLDTIKEKGVKAKIRHWLL